VLDPGAPCGAHRPGYRDASRDLTAATKPSVNTTARLAGVFYLATVPLAFFGLKYVSSVPLVGAGAGPGLQAAVRLLRFGILANVIGLVLFSLAVLALYEIFRPVSERYAVLMAVLGLMSVPMMLLTEVGRLAALRLLTSGDSGQATLFLGLYQDGLFISEIFWGLWLLPLAVLVYRSGFLPRLIGIVVAIGAVAWLADWGTELLLPGRTLPTGVLRLGELALPLWLLIKGVNVGMWQEVASARRSP
jgi:hypothetical protein